MERSQEAHIFKRKTAKKKRNVCQKLVKLMQNFIGHL